MNRGSAGSPRWQYVISSTRGRLMLNTDICLVKNINPLASGRVRRDLDLITDNTDIKTVVEDYATNNINWLNKFGEVNSSIHITEFYHSRNRNIVPNSPESYRALTR